MKVFLGILIFFLAFGWLILLVSAVGLFYTGTVLLSILAGAVLTFLFLPKISRNIDPKTGKIFYFVIFFSLIASFTTSYFSTPTVFGGRDQGSIATAAINLSQKHSLKTESPIAHDLFQKYGSGKALNFPGFDYTKDGSLISRFPPGYTAYLASAYNLAGLRGIQYANFVPLFFFLVIFWLIFKEFFSSKISFLGFLLAATFFPFLWFAKYALTEIYMLFLLWAGIYFLIRLRVGGSTSTMEVEPPNLWVSLAFFALSALTRIEGIIFFLLAVVYILCLQRKNSVQKSKTTNKYLLISTIFLFVIYTYLNFPALSDSLKNLAKTFLPDSTKESVPSANLYSYLARIFFNYNILAYVVLGFAGVLSLAKNTRKNWTRPEFLIIFIVFPAFFYLLTPQITLDEPWLLRRFVFAVFPALIFFSIYALHKFFYHKIFLYISLTILIAANLVVSWRFFTLSENQDLLPQIEKISQKFGDDDLVLVDRMATGSGYSLASEPMRALYGKNAVYFINADDLKHINQDSYENIYLIASLIGEEKSWYSDLIKDRSPVDAEIISNNFLEPSEKNFALAQNIQSENLMVIWKVK